ncbi:MAG: hypothetical protein IPI64_10365 [Chloracidobacterium sp.]|nr:hypothetical protein [Chloracidobacterium sp.]
MTAAGSSAAAFSSPNHKRSVRRSSPPPVVCLSPPSGMIAWWRGEGNAIDARGNYHGLLQNGTVFTAGMTGQAFSFDGTDDHVDLPDGFANFSNGFTVGLWARPTSNGVWARFIDLGNGQANNNILFQRRSTSNDLAFEVYNGSGTSTGMAYAENAITNNEWHYYVATMDAAGQVKLYKDGVALVMAADTTGVPANVTRTSNYIARSNWAADAYYSGGIDEPVIFDRALSSVEIGHIYNAGNLGFCYSCTQPPSGLISMWSAENNPLDTQGRNNAALHGDANYVPGMVGNAFNLDGSGDYVQVAAPTGLPIGSAARTVELWFKAPATPGESGIFQYGSASNSNMFGLVTSGNAPGKLYFYGHNADLATATTIQPNTWYHGAVTYDGTTLKLYINGQLENSAPIALNTILESNGITIGYRVGGSTWSGQIDEPAIYDRALSDTEIAAIYNAGSAGKCNSCTPAPVGLVSWWNGNGNALDARSRNDGTLENGAAYAGGKVGQAFDLGGTGQRVLVGNPASLQLQDFTIETWIKRSSATVLTNNPVPAGPGGAVFAYGTGGYGIGMREATNTVFLTAVEVSYVESPTMPITDTNFHHVAVTKTGNQVVFYVDGNASPPITYDVNFAFTTNAAIGARGDADIQNSFFGVVDDLSIYNRALSAAEVRSVANANGSGKCKPTATTPPAGVVGWWGGDGFVSDISGNANHAALVNGAGFAVGKVGQAFKLDGINDYVEVPHNANINFGATQPMSFEVWLYRTSDAAYQPIFSKRPDCVVQQHYFLHFYPGGNQFGFGATGAPANGVYTTPDKLPLNTWTHVSVSYDGAIATMYVNGVAVANHAMTLDPNTVPLVIGGEPTCGAYFGGQIDDLTFYNRAITQTEIQSIVNAGLAGKLKQMATLSNGNRGRRTSAPNVGFYALAGDATIYFPAVNLSGMTHEIPLDPVGLPPLPLRTVGLTYDIATSAQYTGPLTVCFNLPSFTTTEFATLHILHLENGGWVDVTYASSTYPSLCAVGLTSLSPFAIVTTAPTAAELSIAGRVVTAEGRGIRGAFVNVTGTGGDVRNVATGNLGRYIVDGLIAGETYIVTVRSRRFTFAQPTRVITLNDNVTDADFIGSSGTNREQ